MVRKAVRFFNAIKADLYVPLQQYYELVNYRRMKSTRFNLHKVYLLNMGYGVNSEKEDYGPTIGNIDNDPAYTSKRNLIKDPLGKRYNEDLFFAVKTDTVWGFSEEFKTINTQYNEGVCLSKHRWTTACSLRDATHPTRGETATSSWPT